MRRPCRYDAPVREALILLWEASDRICGKRLKSLIPILIGSMERHGHLRLDAPVRERLLTASAATINRLLTVVRARGPRRSTPPAATDDSPYCPGAHLRRLERSAPRLRRRRPGGAFWRECGWKLCSDHGHSVSRGLDHCVARSCASKTFVRIHLRTLKTERKHNCVPRCGYYVHGWRGEAPAISTRPSKRATAA